MPPLNVSLNVLAMIYILAEERFAGLLLISVWRYRDIILNFHQYLANFMKILRSYVNGYRDNKAV